MGAAMRHSDLPGVTVEIVCNGDILLHKVMSPYCELQRHFIALCMSVAGGVEGQENVYCYLPAWHQNP